MLYRVSWWEWDLPQEQTAKAVMVTVMVMTVMVMVIVTVMVARSVVTVAQQDRRLTLLGKETGGQFCP